MKRQTARSGNLLVSIGVIILLVVLGISVFLVLRQTGFINQASNNNLAERSLSLGLLETNAKNQTLELLKDPSSPKSGNRTMDKTPDTSKARKRTMLALMEKDPRAFLKAALPKVIRDQLPASVKSNVEEEVEVSGTVIINHGDDFQNKKSEEFYFLTTQDMKKYQLFFPAEVDTKFGSGSRIKVKGYLLDKYLVAKGIDQSDLVVESNKLLNPSKEQKIIKVAVILTNFESDKSRPFTKEQATAWMFTDRNSTTAYYRETSFGKWRVSGEVIDWITINMTNDLCDYSAWGNRALEIAVKNGLKTADFTNFMFVFPNVNCGYGGFGQIDGPTSWIFGSSFHYELSGDREFGENLVPIHELGHNFGAHHANAYYCVDESNQQVAISRNCRSDEYGDPYDVMGNTTRQLNGFHRGQLGIMDAKDTIVAKSSGTYTIKSLGKDRKNKELLRIPRTEGVDAYYVEYRLADGYFDLFPRNSPAITGVTIRLAPNYNYPYSVQSKLIDTHPDSNYQFADAPLKPGETFDDKENGIKIKLVSLNRDEAQINVELYTPACTPRSPKLSLWPISQWTMVGKAANYYLTIYNEDSKTCPPAKFTITPTLFTSWQQTQYPSSVQLDPGSYQDIQLSITPYYSTPQNFYTFTERVNHSAGNKYQSSINANLNVYQSDNEPPVASIITPQMQGEVVSGYTPIEVKATDNIAVARVYYYLDSIFLASIDYGNPNYVLYQDTTQFPNGPYNITVEAFDKEGNKSAPATRGIIISN